MVLLQVDQLRLTPVRRVRNAGIECKYQLPSNPSLYAEANAKSNKHPGPGQYFSDVDPQLKKQDFRRPHNQVNQLLCLQMI